MMVARSRFRISTARLHSPTTVFRPGLSAPPVLYSGPCLDLFSLDHCPFLLALLPAVPARPALALLPSLCLDPSLHLFSLSILARPAPASIVRFRPSVLLAFRSSYYFDRFRSTCPCSARPSLDLFSLARPPIAPIAAAPPWSHRRRYPVPRLACCLRHRHHHFPTPPPHPVPHRRRRTHALASTVDFALPVLRGTYSLYHNLTRLRTLGLCFARISAPPVPPPPLPSPLLLLRPRFPIAAAFHTAGAITTIHAVLPQRNCFLLLSDAHRHGR